MKDTVLKNFGKKKESSGQSLKLQSTFKKMQVKPETAEKIIPAKVQVVIKNSPPEIKEKTKNFTFKTEIENLNYLKKLEFAKRIESPQFAQFSVSDVVKEGLVLLKKSGPKLKDRPSGFIPTRRGRVANGTEATKKMSTSFSLAESEVNFIYDYLYTKSGNILGSFTKEEFMNDLINVLKTKYGELK